MLESQEEEEEESAPRREEEKENVLLEIVLEKWFVSESVLKADEAALKLQLKASLIHLSSNGQRGPITVMQPSC